VRNWPNREGRRQGRKKEKIKKLDRRGQVVASKDNLDKRKLDVGKVKRAKIKGGRERGLKVKVIDCWEKNQERPVCQLKKY